MLIQFQGILITSVNLKFAIEVILKFFVMDSFGKGIMCLIIVQDTFSIIVVKVSMAYKQRLLSANLGFCWANL